MNYIVTNSIIYTILYRNPILLYIYYRDTASLSKDIQERSPNLKSLLVSFCPTLLLIIIPNFEILVYVCNVVSKKLT